MHLNVKVDKSQFQHEYYQAIFFRILTSMTITHDAIVVTELHLFDGFIFFRVKADKNQL